MRRVIPFVMALLMAGCVPSLHPLFTQNDLVFDPVLVGIWTDEQGKETWIFQKSGDNAYDVICVEEGAPAPFNAHLMRLGGFLFLDIVPKRPDTKNGFYKDYLIPAHAFSRIWLEGTTLRSAILDPDWLKDMIAQKKVSIAHERVDDTILLTASTEDLQRFMLTYAEDARAFRTPTVFHRQQ